MTTVDRPNRAALNNALDLFRDAMRPFIIRHLSSIPGTNAEGAVKRSLPDQKVAQFNQNIRVEPGNVSCVY